MTNKLVVITNSLKVPKIKTILLYEMKFLVPNYSCLQNPWIGGYAPRSPFSLSSVLNWICWPPPRKEFLGTPLVSSMWVSFKGDTWTECGNILAAGRILVNKLENVRIGLCWLSCRSRRSAAGLGYQKCSDGGSDDRRRKADGRTTQQLLPLLSQKRIECALHRHIQSSRLHLVIPLASK